MYTAALPPGSGFFSRYLIVSASARRFESLLVIAILKRFSPGCRYSVTSSRKGSHTRSPTLFPFTQTSAVTPTRPKSSSIRLPSKFEFKRKLFS